MNPDENGVSSSDRARAANPGTSRANRGGPRDLRAAETNASRRAGTRRSGGSASCLAGGRGAGSGAQRRARRSASPPRSSQPWEKSAREQAESGVARRVHRSSSAAGLRARRDVKRKGKSRRVFPLRAKKNELVRASARAGPPAEDRPRRGPCPWTIPPGVSLPGVWETRREVRADEDAAPLASAQPAIASHAGRVLRVFVGRAATRPVGDVRDRSMSGGQTSVAR